MSKQNRARTRATRRRMAETGETYTQAARAVSGGTDASPGTTDRLGKVLAFLLAQKRAEADFDEAEAEREEARGHRIIDGGSTGPASWSVFDWRTQQLIARGDGDHRVYEHALDQLDPDGKWVHIDTIRDKRVWGAPARKQLPGFPDSFVEALAEWVESPRTAPDEIAALVGWTEQEVVDHLGDG